MSTFENWTSWIALGPPDTLVLLAAVLVVGALAGEAIARLTRWPRVVGYTLAGWAAALGGFGVTMPLANSARVLIDMALALLLFEIGSRVRLRWLRNNPGLLATSALESLVAAVAVYATLTALGQAPMVAAACAVLAIPASAAVAGRVAHEIGAEGQVTQRMTYLTALNTLYGVLALVVLKGWIQAEHLPGILAAVQALTVSSLGALLLAALLGGAVSMVTRRLDVRNESAMLLVMGLVLLAVSTARWVGVSTLLVPLLAGLLLRNVSDRAWVWPRHFGTAGGVLVLMLFVMVGSAWSWQILVTGFAAAMALIAARALSKIVVVLLLSRWSHLSWKQGVALSLTLTPLSATALVMLSELYRASPEFGASIAPIVLTAVAVVELVGPIVVQLALRTAGDVATAAPAPPKEAS
jgi:Kef-type K+ transport system membrane component KefB